MSADIDLLGIGQCSLDYVCTVARMPGPGAKEAALDFALRPGGQVATALLSATRLGLRTALISSTGDDEAADRTLAPLVEAGVDLRRVRRVPGAPSQLALIQIERETGERSVVWHRDPRLALRPEDVAPDVVTSARVLLVDAGDPTVATRAARVARRAGVPVVLDADTWDPALSELLREVDFPIVSMSFARSLAQDGSIRGALAALLDLGATLPVVTLGPGGCLARSREREFPSPGFAVTARDSTGAGDVFHAAFAWGLLERLPPEVQLRTANAAAGLSCRALGAQGALPSAAEVRSFLEREQPLAWREPDPAAAH